MQGVRWCNGVAVRDGEVSGVIRIERSCRMTVYTKTILCCTKITGAIEAPFR